MYRPQLLFHGPSWQVLRQLHIGPETATAILAVDAAPDPIAATIDGVHQLLSAWSGRRTGWLGLPVGAEQWVISAQPRSGPIVLYADTFLEGPDVFANVRAIDAAGSLFVYGSRVHLQRASPWPEGYDV